MGIGASIVLIAVGAILTFATDIQLSSLDFDGAGVQLGGIDLDAVGIILMIVGVLGLVATVVVFKPRSDASDPRGSLPPR